MVAKTSKMEKNVETILETVIFIKEKVETMEGTLDDHTKILDEHTKILDEHTRDLNTIKTDVKTGLDKRKLLDVRVDSIEKHLGFKKTTTV
ncbi:MAG TPA: hypothetical protein VJ043_00370 [Candidatus Paceibacterota bacterium]|nr:hypothetical protein [Candidatus Paceibacterota bacterium]